jgi:hypothetical protein
MTARDELAAMPEWGALDEEDRDAISARLVLGDLPSGPRAGQIVGDLRRLLTRAALLPATISECRAEARRRVPPAPPLGPEGTGTGGSRAVQVVNLRALVPASPLDSAEAVERWVQDVRRRLVELLELGPVRLVDREDD